MCFIIDIVTSWLRIIFLINVGLGLIAAFKVGPKRGCIGLWYWFFDAIQAFFAVFGYALIFETMLLVIASVGVGIFTSIFPVNICP